MVAEKRPITADDLFRFRPVSDLQISPDGSRVLYVVTTHDLENDRTVSSLWLVAASGGEPLRLTNPPEGQRDWAPRWSPDGSRIAFLSDRSKKPQLWVISPDGGEARCIETAHPVGSAPAWSPDGKSLAFTASLFSQPDDWVPYPGAPEGDRTRALEAAKAGPDAPKQGKGAPSDVKVINANRFRFDGAGYMGDKHSQLFVVPADAGEARQVTRAVRNHNGPAWSPDGRYLYCLAAQSADPGPGIDAGVDLLRVEVESGEVSLLFRSDYPLFAAAPSPDGRYLAAVGCADERRTFHLHTELLLWDLEQPSAPFTSLTAPLNQSVTPAILHSDVGSGAVPAAPLQWAADSGSIYFRLSIHGEALLYRAPIGGGSPEHVAGGEERYVAGFSVAAGGSLALLIGDPVSPEEIFLRQGGRERQLTDQNAFHQELDLQRAEPFTFAGADGWTIKGWILKPRGCEPGRRYPAVLDVHGGPQGSWGSGLRVYQQLLAASGIAVLFIDPRGSQGYGFGFTEAVERDWGGKDFQDLMLGLDAAIDMGIIDPDRVGILGWSYGGFMSSWAVTQTNRFRAALIGAPVANLHSFVGTSDVLNWAVRMGGGTPWSSEGAKLLLSRSAVRFADRVTTPCLVVCGEADLRTPISQADEFYTALRMIGKAPAFQVRYPGAFHSPVRPRHRHDLLKRRVAWFAHWLGVS